MTHLPREGAHVVYVVAKRLLLYCGWKMMVSWWIGQAKESKAFARGELRAC